MAHDYAKKPRAKATVKKTPTTKSTGSRAQKAPPAKAAVPGWVWLFVGTAMGAFIMFLVRLAEVDTTQTQKQTQKGHAYEGHTYERSNNTPNKQQSEPVKRTAKTPEPAARQSIAKQNPKPAQKAEAKVQPSEQKPRFDFYHMLKENEVPVGGTGGQEAAATELKPLRTFILQVASFKTAQDAEQVKVELILMNLEARTEEVTVRNGEIWHRVLVGPFESRSKLAKARSTLISNGHQALVMEYKPKANEAKK